MPQVDIFERPTQLSFIRQMLCHLTGTCIRSKFCVSLNWHMYWTLSIVWFCPRRHYVSEAGLAAIIRSNIQNFLCWAHGTKLISILQQARLKDVQHMCQVLVSTSFKTALSSDVFIGTVNTTDHLVSLCVRN
jgi:hypothetical protein